jgi:hypothetical protein
LLWRDWRLDAIEALHVVCGEAGHERWRAGRRHTLPFKTPSARCRQAGVIDVNTRAA